jgi:hypothetical protein
LPANYHLRDEESKGGMLIPPGINCSVKRNSPEEWDSAGNYQLIDEESNQVIISSFTLIQTDKIKMRRLSSER